MKNCVFLKHFSNSNLSLRKKKNVLLIRSFSNYMHLFQREPTKNQIEIGNDIFCEI